MYLVISFSSDIFSNETYCQQEISTNLQTLVDKYGQPTIQHMTTDDIDSHTFDLNYYQFDDTKPFNLNDNHISATQIKLILDSKLNNNEEELNNDKEEDFTEDVTNDNNNEEDEEDVINDLDQKITELISEVNNLRNKINNILSQKHDTPEQSDIVIDLDKDTFSSKKKLFKKFNKMKKRLEKKQDNLMESGSYRYLLIHFDKNCLSDNNELYYGKKTKYDWTSIEYELYHHSGSHMVLFTHINNLYDYVVNTIGANLEKYDIANIFYAKFNLDKEFNLDMDFKSEIWLNIEKQCAYATPARLTYNRFYNEKMICTSITKKDNKYIEFYKSINPTAEYNHYLIATLTILQDEIGDKKYCNVSQNKECTMGDIAKSKYKYSLQHHRYL
jgi:hypothetical protein